jgi:hypothetical protein
MRFYEEYKCGCISALASKKNLAGYCKTHGHERRHIYRRDGQPADENTARRLVKLMGIVDALSRTREGR